MSENKEPNFEGEEMKIPEGMQGFDTEVETAPVNPLSTPVLVALTLILLVIFAGLAYWYYLVVNIDTTIPEPPTRPTLDTNLEPETPTATARTEAMDVVSTSDELSAIEADIESTNLDDLDMEMNAIEAELNAALEAS